jgi:hypothetical protein
MECIPISEENCGTIELAIMVEAGSIVREMGTMTKERRESAYYDKYMNVLHDIPHGLFADDTVHEYMMSMFKGMRKGDMDPGCLLHKYEMEMTMLKKFAYTFPGFVSFNKLPSETPQLQHLWQPVVTKQWVASNPASHVLHFLYWFSSPDILSTHMFLQGIEGLNYDDPVAVVAMIPPNWWLKHKLCKYILSVLVHKDNKDIVTYPTKQPPGPTRKKVREKSRN